jgi:4-alpha-glucanotransferase
MSLRDLARAAGIDADYKDWRGHPTSASDDAVRQALIAITPDLGIDIRSPNAARELEVARWRRFVPEVVLAWDGKAIIPFHVPADVNGDWECEVTTHEGRTFHARGRLFDLPADGHAHPGGKVHCVRRAAIDLDRQLGYHTLRWTVYGESGDALVIAAPTAGYGTPGCGFRRWGVFAPVYGLASPQSGQAGDLANLRVLMDQVAARGGSYVAVLPLLAAFLDEPYAFSPYSPASRLFWNELYLDLGKLAEALDMKLPSAPPPIRVDEPIDYRAHYRWRRPIIDAMAKNRAADESFANGIAAWARQTDAWDYAAFRAIGEVQRTGWQRWPAGLRDGTRIATSRAEAISIGEAAGIAPEVLAPRVDTHIFSQWMMQTQLEQLQGGRVSLYLDLPVGVNSDAYEVWRQRQLFLLDLSAGAPPDALFLGGQNWGLPPLSPAAMRRDRYRYFINCVRHHMSVAGMLRIDHVMGLFRLYCVPSGRPATDGVYIRYPHEELIAVLALESLRNLCIIAGEDLGTVPEHVRPTMTRHGMFRLHVGQWSFPNRPGQAPEPSPAEAVASLNTHDTATFAGWWRGADIDDKRDLGLIDDHAAHQERRLREQQKEAILAFASSTGAPEPVRDTLTEVERAMVSMTTDLATGPAEIVLVALDDLVLDPIPHNVPGTVEQRPNWQRRIQAWSTSLDPERAEPAAAAALAALIAARPPYDAT